MLRCTACGEDALASGPGWSDPAAACARRLATVGRPRWAVAGRPCLQGRETQRKPQAAARAVVVCRCALVPCAVQHGGQPSLWVARCAGDMLSQDAQWTRCVSPHSSRLWVCWPTRCSRTVELVGRCGAEGAELRHLPGGMSGIAVWCCALSRHEPASKSSIVRAERRRHNITRIAQTAASATRPNSRSPATKEVDVLSNEAI